MIIAGYRPQEIAPDPLSDDQGLVQHFSMCAQRTWKSFLNTAYASLNFTLASDKALVVMTGHASHCLMGQGWSSKPPRFCACRLSGLPSPPEWRACDRRLEREGDWLSAGFLRKAVTPTPVIRDPDGHGQLESSLGHAAVGLGTRIGSWNFPVGGRY